MSQLFIISSMMIMLVLMGLVGLYNNKRVREEEKPN